MKFDVNKIIKEFEAIHDIKFIPFKHAETDTRVYDSNVQTLMLKDSMPGNSNLIIHFISNSDNLLESIKATRTALVKRDKKDTIAALTAAQIVELGDGLTKILTAIAKSKAVIEKRFDQLDKVEAINDKILHMVSSLATVVSKSQTTVDDVSVVEVHTTSEKPVDWDISVSIHYLHQYMESVYMFTQAVLEPDLIIQRQALATIKAAYNLGVMSLQNLSMPDEQGPHEEEAAPLSSEDELVPDVADEITIDKDIDTIVTSIHSDK